jgi:NitT/TauT family transport system ATP-binding protein
MEKLTLNGLSHRFGYEYVLEDISFEAARGESVSIIGPSGGGKSTLLRLCAGLEDVQEGAVLNTFKSKSVAFQDARLLPWKNVLDNVILGTLACKIDKKTAEKTAKEMILKFGLKENDFIKYPKDLSGGMLQRVSLARALISNPSLLFLDEPFSALDIGSKKELMGLLLRWLEENNSALFFITHDINEAINLSDRILLLKAEPGKIIKEFIVSKQRGKRDDKFIMSESAKLLKNQKVIETFTWELR